MKVYGRKHPAVLILLHHDWKVLQRSYQPTPDAEALFL
jgi:hypothetical protein